MVAVVVWPSTRLIVLRFSRALHLPSLARQSRRNRLAPATGRPAPARAVPDGLVAAFRFSGLTEPLGGSYRRVRGRPINAELTGSGTRETESSSEDALFRSSRNRHGGRMPSAFRMPAPVSRLKTTRGWRGARRAPMAIPGFRVLPIPCVVPIMDPQADPGRDQTGPGWSAGRAS